MPCTPSSPPPAARWTCATTSPDPLDARDVRGGAHPTSRAPPRASRLRFPRNDHGEGRRSDRLAPVDGVPGWPVAFRGSAAVRAGLVTWDVLQGPRYLRLFPDTYAEAPTGTPTLDLRSRAAYRYIEGRGVVAGHSAAELLGASCGRPDGDAEVIVWQGRQRDHPGLFVCRGQVEP